MPEKSDIPSLDFSKITFPTDSLNVGELRRRMPDFFATRLGRLDDPNNLFEDADVTLSCEMDIAERAFYKALDMPDPDPDRDLRVVLFDFVDGGYQALGITSGSHQSRQLARDIEEQAAAQAEALKGRRR